MLYMNNLYSGTLKQNNVLVGVLTLCFMLSMLSFQNTTGIMPTLFYFNIYYFRHLIQGLPFLALVIYMTCNRNSDIYINKKTFYIYILCIILLFFLTFFRTSINIFDIFRIVVLFPFLFIKQGISFKYSIKYYIWLIIINSVFLSFTQGFFFFDTSRFIFNSNDPNFSAVYSLLGFMICYKLNYKTQKNIFLLMGILTQSRNFFLGIIVFYLIKYMSNLSYFSMILKKIKPMFALVIMQIAIILFGFWYIVNVEPFVGRETLAVNDFSNYIRFTLSTQGVMFLITGSRMAVVDGAGERYWSKAVGGKGSLDMAGGVHNSFLDLLVTRGLIYGIINIIVIFAIVHRYYTTKNYKYIYSYLTMSLFLGGLASGPFLLCWVYILTVKESHN